MCIHSFSAPPRGAMWCPFSGLLSGINEEWPASAAIKMSLGFFSPLGRGWTVKNGDLMGFKWMSSDLSMKGELLMSVAHPLQNWRGLFLTWSDSRTKSRWCSKKIMVTSASKHHPSPWFLSVKSCKIWLASWLAALASVCNKNLWMVFLFLVFWLWNATAPLGLSGRLEFHYLVWLGWVQSRMSEQPVAVPPVH